MASGSQTAICIVKCSWQRSCVHWETGNWPNNWGFFLERGKRFSCKECEFCGHFQCVFTTHFHLPSNCEINCISFGSECNSMQEAIPAEDKGCLDWWLHCILCVICGQYLTISSQDQCFFWLRSFVGLGLYLEKLVYSWVCQAYSKILFLCFLSFLGYLFGIPH